MLVYLRKSHPYYGKYKYKIEFDTSYSWGHFGMEVMKWCAENLDSKEDWRAYETYGDVLYLKNKKDFDLIQKKFAKKIFAIHKPAPGYEDLNGKANSERVLWYNRYPYKVVLHLQDRDEWRHILGWCQENIHHDFRNSGRIGKVGWFFMSLSDATAFKLAYCDKVVETFVPKNSNVKKALKKRIIQAQQDLNIFLEEE